VLTPGQRHEATAFARLLEQGAVRRPGRGRPRLRPGRVVGDKGYTGRRHRASCRRRGIRHTIPRRRTERRTGPFDRAVYRLRNRVERLINRCKQYRSLATRYEKRAESSRTLWVIAATIRWLRD
jgi:transposase